jgi:hypothetical protein
VDGGKNYLKRGGEGFDTYIDLSITDETSEDAKELKEEIWRKFNDRNGI